VAQYPIPHAMPVLEEWLSDNKPLLGDYHVRAAK
jgi:hypothetical protein